MAKLKLKEEHKSTVVHRQVVGFGQRSFVLAEMTAEDVEKWKGRGVDLSEYFDQDKRKDQDTSAADDVEDRYKVRVADLLGNGFKRVKDTFKNAEKGTEISAVEVRDLSDEDYEEKTK